MRMQMRMHGDWPCPKSLDSVDVRVDSSKRLVLIGLSYQFNSYLMFYIGRFEIF